MEFRASVQIFPTVFVSYRANTEAIARSTDARFSLNFDRIVFLCWKVSSRGKGSFELLSTLRALFTVERIIDIGV